MKDKIFTAIYIDTEGNCKIGDSAINSNPDNGKLYIRFKTTPQRLLNGEKYKNEEITKQKLIQCFFGEAIKCLFEHNVELQNGHSIIFIGCPAGKDWLENDNDVQYATLLKEGLIKVGINNIPVVVIPESHAAIAQLQHEREKKIELTNGIDGRYNTVVEFVNDDVRKRITEEFMTMITHKQEMKIYSGFDYIQGTWASLCEGFMIRMARTYETRKGEPFRGIVLLTGGVSRILFVQEICRRVFSQANVETDRQPSYSVSRGLSLFARNEVISKLKENSISTKPLTPSKTITSTTSYTKRKESYSDTYDEKSWVDIKIENENIYDP